jgi:hypothetical protein
VTEPTHEDYTKVLAIMARLASVNRELAAYMRNMATIIDEQQILLEAAQTQIDDMKMRLAVLESARERGH